MTVKEAFEKWFEESDEIPKEGCILKPSEDLYDYGGKCYIAGHKEGKSEGRKDALEDIQEKLLIYEDVSSGDTLEALGYKQGLQRNKALQFIKTELKQ